VFILAAWGISATINSHETIFNLNDWCGGASQQRINELTLTCKNRGRRFHIYIHATLIISLPQFLAVAAL
jgi:hypothetical protein